MMNGMWPFMGSGLGMIFMAMFWFLVIAGFVSALRWLTGNVNKNQCVCSNPATKQRSDQRY